MPSPEEAQAINEALYEGLKELAEPHIEQSNGLLGLLEYDTDKYPSQAYDYYCAPGEVGNIKLLDFIGSMVVPGFVEISDELMTDQRRYQVREVFRDGRSLYVATSHSNIIDPAIGLGAVTNPLRREKEVDNNFETGIIVNKLLSILKYQVNGEWIPCMQVLQWLCDRTYLSYPQSETFRNSAAAAALPPGHIPAHNGKIKEEIEEWLAKGGVALGVAPSGSTHKEKVHRWSKRPKILLPEVTKGTARMPAHEYIRVLSLIMDIDPETPFIEAAVDGLYEVKRWQGIHRIPRDMAKAFNERNAAQGEGIPHDYPKRRSFRDLPVLRNRYVVLESPEPAGPGQEPAIVTE